MTSLPPDISVKGVCNGGDSSYRTDNRRTGNDPFPQPHQVIASSLAYVSWRRHAKLLADRADQAWPDLFVAWHGGDLILRAAPLRMLRAADLSAAVGNEMAFEFAALHAAAVNRRCSRSASAASPASSSSGVRTV